MSSSLSVLDDHSRYLVALQQTGVPTDFVRGVETQGKVERFHGALERARSRPDAGQWLEQRWLDNFRYEYNQLRPHEALSMQTPASLWRPSTRKYDPNPPDWDYGERPELRKVGQQGEIYLDDRPWKVSRALVSETVQLQRVEQRILVYFCTTLVREIDLSVQRSTAMDR